MESTKNGQANSKESAGGNRRLRLAVAAVLAIGLILWIALRDDNGDDSPSSSSEAQIVSVDSLREEAAEEPPIYWAGEQAGAELELSRPDADRTYVRYLTRDAEAGDPQPDFLTIGTYEDEDALAKLKRQGKEPGGVLAKAPGGATVYFNRNQPSSVYLVYPGVDAQIEVYDPDFERALELVNSGQVVAAD